jgi:hypothetical protein
MAMEFGPELDELLGISVDMKSLSAPALPHRPSGDAARLSTVWSLIDNAIDVHVQRAPSNRAIRSAAGGSSHGLPHYNPERQEAIGRGSVPDEAEAVRRTS